MPAHRPHALGLFAAPATLLALTASSLAQPVFFDDFNAGPSPLWDNLRGNWTTANGEYFAQAPQNLPPTFTSVPFTLRDFVLDVDVHRVDDGGIWLRTGPGGDKGVLLVTGGFLHTGTGLYWHIVENNSYSPALNQSAPLFTRLTDIHIRVVVRGDLYAAYINGQATPATTLTTDRFLDGRAGLYDFSAGSQAFDNFNLNGICSLADIVSIGGQPPPDGILSGDDFIAFINAFASGETLADIVGIGGLPPPDGLVTGDDFVAFINAFAQGCP